MRTIDTLPIFEVRHGESEQNLDKEAYRDVDPDIIPLTDEGHAQGRRAGIFLNRHLAQKGLKRIRMLISPHDRASGTADNILVGLDETIKVTVDVLRALSETRFLQRRADGSLVPAPDGQNVFGRGLEGETRNEWRQRMKDITHAIEDAAVTGSYDAVMTVGHQSTTRLWTAIEYLERPLEAADGFPEMGNANIWRCHGNRVQAIYPNVTQIAHRQTPGETMHSIVTPVPFRMKPR